MHNQPTSFKTIVPTLSTAHGELSATDRAKLRAIGRVWNDDISGHRAKVIEAYGPVVAGADNAGIAVARDLAYGPDPRQVLDVFTPGGAHARPVVMFVHGGAFTRGSKSVDGRIYDNVLYWFARQGFVGINVEYRLAPQAQFPAGAEDLSLAVRWAAEHVGSHGGDPASLVLIGHSAGGCHLGSYLLDPEAGTEPHPAIRAAVFLSARLRLETRSDNPNAAHVAACFGNDPDRLAARSPVSHAARCRWPALIAFAEYENRHLDLYAVEFAYRMALAHGRMPRLLQLRDHNHTSIVAHFNSGEDALGQDILRFLVEECGIGPADRSPHAAGGTPSL